jgi:hypothetical protein
VTLDGLTLERALEREGMSGRTGLRAAAAAAAVHVAEVGHSVYRA